MNKKQKLLKEVEEIFKGLETVSVNTSGHMKPCRYRTFLKGMNDNEIEVLYASYDTEKIKMRLRNDYKPPKLPDILFGRNSNTREYSKKGTIAIEDLFGILLPENTPYTIIQAILKDPKALLTDFVDW